MPVAVQSHQPGQFSFDERMAAHFARKPSGGLAQMAGPSGNLSHSLFSAGGQPASQPLAHPAGNAFTRQDMFAGRAQRERASGSLAPRPGGLASPLRPVLPGTSLRGGRYRVQELQSRQDWQAGVFEVTWIGRDSLREMQVMIQEVGIPGAPPEQTLPIMHTATLALLALQHYPQVSSIVDAFSDQGRSFFVFELIEGETLMDRLRHLQRPLPEQEVVEYCLQLSDILETLKQKAPSLVHGAIRPEHIYRLYNGSRCILGNFSILVAGRATRLVTSGEGFAPSPYTPSEFARGFIDARSDIYAVLASAYHLVTGNMPLASAAPPAQSVNPALSPTFSAILTRGLHFAPQQRYQSPSQLRQDLLTLHTPSSGLGENPIWHVQGDIADSFPPLQQAPAFPSRPGEFAQSTPYLLPIVPPPVLEEERVLVPAPETLPPLRMGNERLEAVLMLLAALLGLGLLTALSNFHV
ncbi:MAG TPA: protein kinase [Ktedonobacteraceae bacterium]|jgi:serine/threonine protein kinase